METGLLKRFICRDKPCIWIFHIRDIPGDRRMIIHAIIQWTIAVVCLLCNVPGSRWVTVCRFKQSLVCRIGIMQQTDIQTESVVGSDDFPCCLYGHLQYMLDRPDIAVHRWYWCRIAGRLPIYPEGIAIVGQPYPKII